MNAPLLVVLVIAALSDGTLGFTATMTGAMVVNGALVWPTHALWLFATLIGLGAAFKEVRSQIHVASPPPPPPPPSSDLILQELAQLRARFEKIEMGTMGTKS